ncbi:archaemetzincin [Aspergillus stella-maris]|uniref:archaemetzincin n=1 Tax=Aspergillus stella-maris TaxID=1810926 RepID=UPI003CCC9A21
MTGPCSHSKITYAPSPHASEVGYVQPSKQARLDATKPSAAQSNSSSRSKSITKTKKPKLLAPLTRTDIQHFPAPLVLPDDDLALDPEYPAQSYQEWYDEEERNSVTARRKTVYVVRPPGVVRSIGEVQDWAVPIAARQAKAQGKARGESSENATVEEVQPNIEDVQEYLSAFFYGLPVKELNIPNEHWKFTPWDDEANDSDNAPPSKKRKPLQNRKAKQTYLSLPTGQETIRIRARRSPHTQDVLGAIYSHQLNLNDLLDVAIEILPSDAYALCMLVHHDLYEDDEDLFVCGRAYGGSRVAVVSSARYRPSLDEVQVVESVHSWPFSHCVSYMEDLCGGKEVKDANPLDSSTSNLNHPPLESALCALFNHNHQASQKDPSKTWLYRTLRTISHEICHCFGLDHCVYYACIMQGSASVAEDARQPPYLCPIDLAKVLAATGATLIERDEALLGFCERGGFRGESGFEALAGWLRGSSLRDEDGG